MKTWTVRARGRALVGVVAAIVNSFKHTFDDVAHPFTGSCCLGVHVFDGYASFENPQYFTEHAKLGEVFRVHRVLVVAISVFHFGMGGKHKAHSRVVP